jgi:hypothetical protein
MSSLFDDIVLVALCACLHFALCLRFYALAFALALAGFHILEVKLK